MSNTTIGSAKRAYLRAILIVLSATFVLIGPGTARGYEFGTQVDPWESKATTDRLYAEIPSMGARWVRVDGEWSTIQAAGPNSWDFTRADMLVDAAARNGLKAMATMTYTPKWARPGLLVNDDKAAPQGAMIAAFGTFCKTTAQHFKSTGRSVPAYEIWNEPNHQQFFKPVPNVAQYVDMLKACSNGIRSVNPAAIIVTGGTSPTGDSATEIAPVTFIKGIYANGGKPYFNAVGAHPYTYTNGVPSKDPNAVWNAWSQMGAPGYPYDTMRSVMIANQDWGKKIWGTEWGASVGSRLASGQGVVTDALQSYIFADGMRLWKSYDWAGVLFAFTYFDYDTGIPGEASFGIVRRDFTHKPVWDVYRNSSGGQAPVSGAPTLDTSRPTAFMAAPTIGAQVSGTQVMLSAGANDNYGISKVYIYVDGNLVGPTSCGAFGCVMVWNSTLVANGLHTVSALAYDYAGNSAYSPTSSVRVVNGIFITNQPNFTGWAHVDTLGFGPSLTAWAWVNNAWQKASYTNEQWVWVVPWGSGWSWTWTKETGWLAVRAYNVRLP